MMPRRLPSAGPEDGYRGLLLMRQPEPPIDKLEVYWALHLAQHEDEWKVLAEDHWDE